VRRLSALVDINNNSEETNQLRLSLASNSTAVSPHSTSILNQPADFSNFNLVSEHEISKISYSCPKKQSDLDLIST